MLFEIPYMPKYFSHNDIGCQTYDEKYISTSSPLATLEHVIY